MGSRSVKELLRCTHRRAQPGLSLSLTPSAFSQKLSFYQLFGLLQEGLVSWRGNSLAKTLYFSLLFSTLLYLSLPYSLLRAILQFSFCNFPFAILLPPIAKYLYFSLLFSTFLYLSLPYSHLQANLHFSFAILSQKLIFAALLFGAVAIGYNFGDVCRDSPTAQRQPDLHIPLTGTYGCIGPARLSGHRAVRQEAPGSIHSRNPRGHRRRASRIDQGRPRALRRNAGGACRHS